MSGDIRWIAVPSNLTRQALPEDGARVVFVAIVDVLAALDRPNDLREVLEGLLQAEQPVPDFFPSADDLPPPPEP